MKNVILVFVLFLGIGAGNGVSAQNTELPPGDEIIRRANERDFGAFSQETIHMKLIGKDGKARERVTRAFNKKFGEERRYLMVFVEPSNVKGTALLTYDYLESSKDDDQWLYLPAMRKSRRVPAGERGGAFLGTDFTFEDIKTQSRISVEDYSWKTLGIGDVDGHPCYTIEATPLTQELAKELGYAKVRIHLDQELLLLRLSEFCDDSGEVTRTISIRDFEQVGDIWTAGTLEAKNLKTGHSTLFTVTESDFTTEIPDDVFSLQSLERGLPNLPGRP
ncbi:MAG: outer membrane lipoprotein-sorting protein [Candidatus Hydrogenedentes bacterium]|nr:outer membrane lipoprotein-sorting protein [Candidatus Hydrogenedentota bacterium]